MNFIPIHTIQAVAEAGVLSAKRLLRKTRLTLFKDMTGERLFRTQLPKVAHVRTVRMKNHAGY